MLEAAVTRPPVPEAAMKITFVNHACVKISCSDAVILCDPWIEGSAFNLGWDLLVPTPIGFDELTADVTHVWLSHEHPDHFVPKFISQLARARAGQVSVLFQKTRDGRVKKFCESKGLAVIELEDKKRVAIAPETSVSCGTHDFYDSWLHVRNGEKTLLNLNDCQIDNTRTLTSMRRSLGRPDLLLTQFSYAAWKGGRSNASYRRFAAQRKLQTMSAQISALAPAYALPFASMVYFSNQENAYMNDSVNDVATAERAIRAAGSTPLVLFPGESAQVGEAHDNRSALAQYADRFAKLDQLALRPPGESVSIEALREAFESYRRQIFEVNSEALIRALRKSPLIGAFHPVTIKLHDLDQCVSVSVVDGFELAARDTPDVSMHSSSLAFVFSTPFGYDTLTVNGRFEATPTGFARMTKSLAIGSLNAMGLSISPRILRDSWVVLLLLEKLSRVVLRLRAQGKAGATTDQATSVGG